jgi:hypothetical protein
MRIYVAGLLVVTGLGLAACSSGSSTATASTGATPTTTGSGPGTTSSSGGSGAPSTAGCPTAATVTGVMGETYTGPVTGTNGGTAPCVYTGTDGTQVNVLFNAPGLSKSAFASQAMSDQGPTATAVPGVGGAAYASTAYGHAEIEVWVSEDKSFSITIDTSDATVQPDNAAQAQAIATAIVNG